MGNYLNLRHIICQGLIFAFLLNSLGPIPAAQAQDYALPTPGAMVSLSPAFNPPILKGIKVHPDNPFRFDFILDKGDSKESSQALKDESSKLIKYFLASLTIPEKDLWVNLSPYEKNRIVPESFGQTEMGRDLLAEDYMLKQITASLIYPEGEVGKRFWKRIYEVAAKRFGTTNIPVNTFNKVWIVPEKAVVYENAKAGTAYVVESKLKVMLEQDYLSLEKHAPAVIPAPAALLRKAKLQGGIQDTSTLGSQIVREIVIPELTKEVNYGRNFSQLRQVYNSLILATWYKKKIKDSILAQVYANKNKIKGLSSPNVLVGDPEHIYQRYLQAFKKGAYNYIKEEVDPISQQTIPRKYFSGGTFLGNPAMTTTSVLPKDTKKFMAVKVNLVISTIRKFGSRLFYLQLNQYGRTKKIKERLEAINRKYDRIGHAQGISRIELYLDLLKNKDKQLIKGVPLAIHRAGEGKQRIYVELGSGDTENAVKLPQNALIFATDPYNANLITADRRFFPNAYDFKHFDLPAQKLKLESLRTLRAFADIMLYFPDASIDGIVLVQPIKNTVDDLIVLIRDFNLLKKLKAGAQIAILADDRTMEYLRQNLQEINFIKQPDTTFLGADLAKNTPWQKEYFADLYVATVNDAAKKGGGKEDGAMNNFTQEVASFIEGNKQFVQKPRRGLFPRNFTIQLDENSILKYEGKYTEGYIFNYMTKKGKMFGYLTLEWHNKLYCWEVYSNFLRINIEKKEFVDRFLNGNDIFLFLSQRDHYFKISPTEGLLPEIDDDLKRDIGKKFHDQVNEILNFLQELFERSRGKGFGQIAISSLAKVLGVMTSTMDLVHFTSFAERMWIRMGAKKEIFNSRGDQVYVWRERLTTKSPVMSSGTGGIDLTSDKALSVQNNGQGIKFHLDPAQLAQLQNTPGFVPVIISIQPLKSLQEFLGGS